MTKDALARKDFSEIAYQRSGGRSTAHLKLGGGLLLGLVTGLVINPVTGGAVVLWMFWSAFQDSDADADNASSIQKGNLAHLLEGKEFHLYLQTVGLAAVQGQLLYAMDQGLALSATALHKASDWGLEAQLKELQAAELIVEPAIATERPIHEATQNQIESFQSDPGAIATGTTEVGPTTRLGAIEVSAEPAQNNTHMSLERSLAATPVGLQRPTVTATSTCRDLILANPFISSALYGGQRVGKSYLMAVLSKAFAEMGITILHINLYSVNSPNGGNEDERYYRHIHPEHSVRSTKQRMADPVAREQALHLCHQLVDFWADESAGPCILIVDEWAQMSSSYSSDAGVVKLVEKIANHASFFASAGFKSSKGLFTMAPQIVAGAMNDQGKVVKCLRPILLAVHPSSKVTWNGLKVNYDVTLEKQFQANYSKVPEIPASLTGCDRIALIEGHWMPIGTNGTELSGSTPPVYKRPEVSNPEPSTQVLLPQVTPQKGPSQAIKGLADYALKLIEKSDKGYITIGTLIKASRKLQELSKDKIVQSLRIAEKHELVSLEESQDSYRIYPPYDSELDSLLDDIEWDEI